MSDPCPNCSHPLDAVGYCYECGYDEEIERLMNISDDDYLIDQVDTDEDDIYE